MPDLVEQASRPIDHEGDALAGDGEQHSTGIVPSQDLRAMVQRKEIDGIETITDDQFQPASLDLRLGGTAYRVRASFLPGSGSVQDKLDALQMHKMDITSGGVLQRG